MLRSQAARLHTLILVIDMALSACLLAAVLSRPEFEAVIRTPGLGLLGVVLAGTFSLPILFDWVGLYGSQRRTQLSELLGRMALAAVVSITAIGAMIVVTGSPLTLDFALLVGGLQLGVVGGLRLAIFGALRFVRRHGRNYRNVLVIGSGRRAAQLQQTLEANRSWGLRILGFVDDCDGPADPRLRDAQLFKLADVPSVVREHVVDEVVVACPRSMLEQITPLMGLCAEIGVQVTLLADLFTDFLPSPSATSLGEVPALSFATVRHNSTQLGVKRLIDVVVSFTALVASAPVLAVAAVLIRLDSPGPVFFRQSRCGLYGRVFTMLKLRTMYEDSEARKAELAHLNELDGPVFKIANDPRVTRVGRFLRRYSVDELPQLWNVLVGHMSLVGPRPPIPGEVDEYRLSQRRRLSMRPGLTCLWQVGGRNHIGFEEWVRLDLEYIDHWSLSEDLRILARTVPVVLRGEGAS
ncbi:MAG: sugar transferase [Deltaproteobacteria bacterium]|nr:sugar transferase [Deltaproteobacteria bacterium]